MAHKKLEKANIIRMDLLEGEVLKCQRCPAIIGEKQKVYLQQDYSDGVTYTLCSRCLDIHFTVKDGEYVKRDELAKLRGWRGYLAMPRYLVAARENVEMWAFPNGAFAVRVGDKARMFDEGSCPQANWMDAYAFFHQVNDSLNKKEVRQDELHKEPEVGVA